ncbi:tRNA dihydrouridine synthase DusB [Fusicatenibacter sp.]
MENKKRTLQKMPPLKIGSVEIPNPLVLAPMAGVTDLPFRVLCKEQGAGLICMEMVSAKAILYKNKNTEDLMTIDPGEHPVSLQLFGSDPEILGQIAAQIEERPFDILDFNMGCPVPKVVNNGEGSALMKDPHLVREIVTSMVKAVKKPVTVKIRKGFNEESANAVEIAKILEDCGVAAIAVHGRTRAQFYSGKADWDIIRRVKEAVSIPVIGNGDVTDAASAGALVEQTGCDGIMIGRGAEGNPWIFKQILHYMETGETLAKPTQHEVKEMMLRHARMQVEYKGGAIGIREMRKHVAWYTAGFPHSAKLRAAINQVESLQALEQMLNEWERG